MRFLLLFASAAALLVAVYLGTLYGFTSYQTIQAALEAAMVQIKPATLPYTLPGLAHTATRYGILRGIIGWALGVATVSFVALALWWGRLEIRGLAQDIARAFQSVAGFWRGLARVEQWTAGVVLLLIVGMRYWFLRNTAFDPDEMVSLDHFVQHGSRITASFYQLPNNHIFYNVLSAVLLRLAPEGADPELLVRLPAFVLGIVATVLVYAVLACLSSFRVATCVLCGVQLVPISIEYTVAARGYGLQAACVYMLFLAAVVLLRGPRYHRLAWAVAVTVSLWGFYLIPTFIYPFLSLGVGLVCGVLLQKRGRARIAQALVAGTTVLVLASLLYSPVVLLSGWHTLFANPFVTQLSTDEFWTLLGPYYLWGLVGSLFGLQSVTIPLLLLLVSGGLLLIRWWAPKRHWPVAALAWVGMVGPLPLLMVQRVFAPPRTVHYIVFFGLLLAVLLAEAVVRRFRVSGRVVWLAMGSYLVGYAGFRVPRQVQSLEINRVQRAQAERAYDWLQLQHPHRVFTNAQIYHAYMQHLAVAGRRPPLPLRLAGEGPESGTYDYLMLKRGSQQPVWANQQHYRLAYEHADLLIYRLATKAPTPNASALR